MRVSRIKSRKVVKRLALIGLAVTLAVAAIVLWGIVHRARVRRVLLTNSELPVPRATPAAAPAAEGQQGKLGNPTPTRTTIPFWDRVFWETSPQPRGYVPASIIDPPPPPRAPPPPPPRAPPNPIANRPTMYNPGGINGDRPERPVPGQQ